ncbi:hypothetical protein HQ305_16715 [Rhodococcus sp. BP-149]|uniref:hypothetical protein n=1 Tax=unclassified Rhodococcus (in: high G+C Gram-positive bacteria) TaxID=192944 RepID=UPI001C9AD017|nr:MULTISPECIES: hypothetical protein [unclassified Rhodococcus (in: high G+C Gram-positive bacteria)]MBY6687203.1 hypothetical protein [Rhodococcus sp. BP-288]MBY6694374.1 hypothetical protein [Rhodococcus sp. BP-188]MBY6698083.1 hypothetical protein [Rhodococcus sp. BP-285]MBY6704303.1 hypothetical protein [Rhodococcus sp. BP-283]MBY6712952.1 hypothetical protein [Rhodococcus sp. BP-160]
MTRTPASDPTMNAIAAAVTEGRGGDVGEARRQLLALWQDIGVDGDPLHRCSLAHYLADLYEDPAQALTWDVRALDAAHAVSEKRAQDHHAGLNVAGFFPSLHLNLADNYCKLGSFNAAREHIESAKECSSTLADDPYGDLIRGAIGRVDAAISRHDGGDRL